MYRSTSSEKPTGKGHAPDPTKSRLSESRQRLVTLVQRVHFGRVESVPLRAGEPVLDPTPRTIRTFKTAGRNTPRSQLALTDFALRHEWVEFFGQLDAVGDGTVLLIEVAHGLPLFFEFEEVVGT